MNAGMNTPFLASPDIAAQDLRLRDPREVVIVGGGLAGLFCALKLAPHPVTILSAAPLGEGASSAWAQGGIAAAIAEGDSAESHARDTIAVGGGIVDEAIALGLAREAGERVQDLLRYGVPFDRELDGRLAVAREAAHSARRIVHVRGDMAGRAIISALIAAVRATPSIRVVEGVSAESLLAEDGRVRGLIVRRANEKLSPAYLMAAHAVVLATGGIGHLYAVTTNPVEASGVGLAMAARAGAVIADAEFVQFHPTAIMVGRDPAPLATEALRGEGAWLIDGSGERFMPAIHPLAELAPRDIVARGVFAQIAAGRGAYLDATRALGASFADRFPTVHASCMAAGIDPATRPIPIAPAAHFHMGGIAVDARGRSSLEGLWAAGEVSSTGAHGANRLASNSLLEAIVYAARIAEDLAAYPFPAHLDTPRVTSAITGDAPFDPDAEQRLRRIMSMHVGVMREAEGLSHAIAEIGRIERGALNMHLRNMACTALIVATAAFARHESRGAHFRTDFPHDDPALAHRTMMSLDDARRIADESDAQTIDENLLAWSA